MSDQGYKNYLLTLLLVILAFNFVDRLALGLLLQDIKTDLSLTDTEIGFLTGIAFALFYATMGIPLARWADRGDRVAIISITTALWSVAVALSGMAVSFLQLLVIRVGVAIGEAGCIPPAHSLIAAYFSRTERPRAIARYMLGAPLSIIIGYSLAGWLNELYGWRVTFVILGAACSPLAALAWLTLKEPRRSIGPTSSGRFVTPSDATYPAPGIASSSTPDSLRDACLLLLRNTTYRHLLASFSVLHFFGYGIQQWQPAFFIRTYGFQTGELGSWLAGIWAVGGLLGTYCGGELASRKAYHERVMLKAMATVVAAFAVISTLIYLAPNQYLALGALGLTVMVGSTTTGPLFATIQSLVPEHKLAMSIALMYLFANLIGMGLGPLAAGAISDVLRAIVGEESLRYALFALSPGYLWAAWHLLRASKTVMADLDTAKIDPDHRGACKVHLGRSQRAACDDQLRQGRRSQQRANP